MQENKYNVITYHINGDHRNADKYEGGFNYGKPNGRGTYTFANGGIIEAYWKNGDIASGDVLFRTKEGWQTKFYFNRDLKIEEIKGEIDHFIITKKSANPEKPDKKYLTFGNKFYNNGFSELTNKESQDLAKKLEARIKKTNFKDKISFQQVNEFNDIKSSNSNKIRLIMKTCPGHQFNIMLDETIEPKRAFILDNGGLLTMPKDRDDLIKHLKSQGFTTSYHEVKFKDRNDFVSCVNQSQVMMEKLCRWFERGDMYKNIYKQDGNTFLSESVTGEELIEKINQTTFSIASNILKMKQNNEYSSGSGYNLDVSNLTREQLEGKEKFIIFNEQGEGMVESKEKEIGLTSELSNTDLRKGDEKLNRDGLLKASNLKSEGEDRAEFAEKKPSNTNWVR